MTIQMRHMLLPGYNNIKEIISRVMVRYFADAVIPFPSMVLGVGSWGYIKVCDERQYIVIESIRPQGVLATTTNVNFQSYS